MAKVLLSIPDKFLNQIDEFAEIEQRTRSELIREALRTYMKRSTMFDSKKTASDAEMLDKLLDWFSLKNLCFYKLWYFDYARCERVFVVYLAVGWNFKFL